MDKTKLFVLLVIFIVIIGGVVYYFVSSPPADIKLRIFIFNNDYLRSAEHDSAFSWELTTLLMEKYNPTALQIKLYGSTKLPKSEFELKRKPGENEKIWRAEVYKKIFDIFKDTVDISLSNESANDLFVDFLRKIEKEANDKEVVFVFAGSFPNCYNYTSRSSLIAKIKEFVKDKNFEAKQIYSLLINPRKGLEEDIIDSLKAIRNFKLEEIALAPDLRRECFETKFPRFFGMFLKKLDYRQSSNFLDFIKRIGGEQFMFTIWNDGPKNDTRITYSDDKIDSTDFVNILQGVQDADWTSVNFLFKQAYHQLSLLPDTIKKHWVFVGSFPPAGDQPSLNKEYWDGLKKIKNLVIYHYLPSRSKKTSYEKRFFEVIQKYYGLNVVNE